MGGQRSFAATHRGDGVAPETSRSPVMGPTSQTDPRDAEFALMLMDDLRGRLANRVQLTTDGHSAYLRAVEEAFGADIDYSMLIKLTASRQPHRRPHAATARESALERARTRSRASRSEARQHVLCRKSEFDDADGDAPLHPPYQRIQREARKPRTHGRALCALVQLRPGPQDTADLACDGGRHRNPALVDGGYRSLSRTAGGHPLRGSAGWVRNVICHAAHLRAALSAFPPARSQELPKPRSHF